MRTLELWDAGIEPGFDGFQLDQLMAAAAGAGGNALLRAWSRPQPALSVGRFHRIDAGGAGMQRRLSGGRIVPVGPGVLGVTLAVPSAAWLAHSTDGLRPEQVLNRALRPVLAALRDLGVDAFYPGRDVVTVGSKTVVYASFTAFADDVLLVEQLIAVEASFAALEPLAAAFDPGGVAGADRTAFRDAVSLADCGGPIARARLVERIAAAAGERFACEVVRTETVPGGLAQATRAEASAYEAFQRERGPVPTTHACAAEISMLGAVEAAARIEAGRLHDVEITGDVIAPFATVDAVAVSCEGVRAGTDEVRSAVARALLAPGSFVLGANDLAELLVRLR